MKPNMLFVPFHLLFTYDDNEPKLKSIQSFIWHQLVISRFVSWICNFSKLIKFLFCLHMYSWVQKLVVRQYFPLEGGIVKCIAAFCIRLQRYKFVSAKLFSQNAQILSLSTIDVGAYVHWTLKTGNIIQPIFYLRPLQFLFIKSCYQ